MKAKGFDDLSEFVADAARDGAFASEDAVRATARNTAAELRRIVRKNFGAEWRVWDAGSFSKSIRLRRIAKGYYRVDSKAIYSKKRSGEVNLLWVFDTAPVVRGNGRPGVSIPLKNGAPIAANGRRFAWPAEAEAMGWDLSFAPIEGKTSVLILGRRNRFEDPIPLYIWKPDAKMPKRLDLDGLHNKHAAKMETVWGDILDRKAAKRAAQALRGGL
ncbi:hypothetical protein GVN18_39250 [Pseudomonas sp. ODNR1LW]|nr:hypothetical protein [Pseudomonas sp. ODNR1LW]